MSRFTPYLKALMAAFIAGLSALSAYLVNDTSLADITAGQWCQVALAFFVALAAVWAVPNSPQNTP